MLQCPFQGVNLILETHFQYIEFRSVFEMVICCAVRGPYLEQ